MNGLVDNKGPFRHSWWRIFLIVFAIIAFIITCVFNGLAGVGPNGMNDVLNFNTFSKNISRLGVFNQQTGSVSDNNPTDFTPSGEFHR